MSLFDSVLHDRYVTLRANEKFDNFKYFPSIHRFSPYLVGREAKVVAEKSRKEKDATMRWQEVACPGQLIRVGIHILLY